MTRSEMPLRLTPRLKLPDNLQRTLWLVNEPIQFAEHWLERRSWICPGTDCPACETWSSRAMTAAIGLADRKGGPRLIIAPTEQWPDEAHFRLGTIVRVTGGRKGYTIEVTGKKRVTKAVRILDQTTWECIATMHRLPWRGDEPGDPIQFLLDAARRQLHYYLQLESPNDG